MNVIAALTRIGCLLLMLWSQSFTAAVHSVIADPSGAAVAKAKIVITQAERNVQRTTTTDDEGRYLVSDLPPGQYTLTVEAN